MIGTGLPEARAGLPEARAKKKSSLAERSALAIVLGAAVGTVVGAGLVLSDNYSNRGTLHRRNDPHFKQTIRSAGSDCPTLKGGSPFTVPDGIHPIPIGIDELLDFIEEDSDDCQTEGMIQGPDGSLFVKPSYPTSFVFAKIFDLLNEEVLSKEFSSIYSKIVAPEQTIVQAETGQLLASTRQIKPADGRPFRSFRFDRFKQLDISHRENPYILSMTLVALCIVPHLHNRDMGVCDGALCVTDLDNTDFSLSTFYSTALMSLMLLIDHKIPILNDHSITTATKILQRVRDEIHRLDFSLFDCITMDVLEENKASIINYMKHDNINKLKDDDTRYNNDLERSFTDLLDQLKTQTTPQLLKEALALRIYAGLTALNETLKLKETPNLKLTMQRRLDEFKSQLRTIMIQHSSTQHNRSKEEIRGHADAATRADQLSNELWELLENTMESDPEKMSEDDKSNLEKHIIELQKEVEQAGRSLSGYSEDRPHWLYVLSAAIRLFSENTYARNPDNDQKLEL